MKDAAPPSAEIDSIFQAQKAAQDWRRTAFDADARLQALKSLGRAIDAHEADILAALRADLGRCDDETLLVELMPLRQELHEALRSLKRWTRPRRVRGGLANLGTVARLRPEPKGCALIMAPWNYPVSLALSPLVSCLAAGNSAIVKPSELAPRSAEVIARVVAAAFPADLVAVVQGGREVAERLLDLPVDHIFFTGSPEVGRVVMAAAARHLASVTLELGGKSPCIIGPGADVKRAARWVAIGKFANAGQTCIAPDHVFVHESLAQPFRAALRAEIDRMYPQGAGSPDLAAIVSDRHLARLTGHLAEALSKGGSLLAGGTVEGRRLAPTVIEAITPDMALDQEEIFGPILPVMDFSDINAVIHRINMREKPLALYIFEHNRHLIDKVIASTSSGGVGINLTILQFSFPGLPFGGINTSGIGSAHGEWGFKAFSHAKPVLENRFSPAARLFAPFDAPTRRLLGLVRRFAV